MNTSFSRALEDLKAGLRVTRSAWRFFNAYLELQVPDAHSKMTMPYIYMTADGKRVPWCASHADLLADDWEIAK